MRKFIAIILAVMLMVSMAVTASAVTAPIGKLNFKMPTIKTVDVPYSTVYESAKVAIKANIINNLYNGYHFG